jgi:hypothetical protein
MAIDDVRPKIQVIKQKKLAQMILLHPDKVLIKIIIKKRTTMIKGEMRMMERKAKHNHIQECVKMFKEITPSTTYLVISKNG